MTTLFKFAISLLLLFMSLHNASGFQQFGLMSPSHSPSNEIRFQSCKRLKMDTTDSDSSILESSEQQHAEVAAAAAKFEITTCMSPSCNRKRKEAGLDPLSTFAAMYERSKQAGAANGNSDLFVNVEESPCMGACQYGPCVSIQHDDFVGSVALEGMTETEFADRTFQNILTEEDADRVWESVENAVQVMAEGGED